MIRKLAIGLAILCFTAGVASAQTVAGSPHDFSSTGNPDYDATNVSETCVFCHTPHQASGANAQDPLWNHSMPTAAPTYGVYGSDTLDADMTGAEVGAVAGSASVSMLCMSCHDGTLGVGSLYNDPGPGTATTTGTTPDNNSTLITGAALVGTSLVDDHPINFNYAAAATADTEINAPDSVDYVDAGNLYPLFGGSMQCATCHDPHDNSNTVFLVESNANSDLCTTCHAK